MQDGQAMDAFLRLAHGVDLGPERARQMGRMVEAVRGAIETAAPEGLFDTEPAGLRTRLESAPVADAGSAGETSS